MSDGSIESKVTLERWVKNILPFVFAFMESTMMEVLAFANRKEKEYIQAEKEKLEIEVQFLKSQINPHFLFNALNNIYSLSILQSPETPESVMQLSEILHYTVYNSNANKVAYYH